MGDFNIIHCEDERKGGRPRQVTAMEDFNGFIESCGLMDLPSNGNTLSWCNGHAGRTRCWARMDRCFMNMACLNL